MSKPQDGIVPLIVLKYLKGENYRECHLHKSVVARLSHSEHVCAAICGVVGVHLSHTLSC